MEEDIPSVSDILAKALADMDKTQAWIDHSRSILNNRFLSELDQKQVQLDLKRERVRVVKEIADIVYPK